MKWAFCPHKLFSFISSKAKNMIVVFLLSTIPLPSSTNFIIYVNFDNNIMFLTIPLKVTIIKLVGSIHFLKLLYVPILLEYKMKNPFFFKYICPKLAHSPTIKSYLSEKFQ